MNVKLEWATPDIDKAIMRMARVSNPANQNSENSRLLYYCMEHGHVSPFEMASACLEINTTRDIAHQILRHRSFSFQEFSQRYADIGLMGEKIIERECRLQDTKNRQNSIDVGDDRLGLQRWWTEVIDKSAAIRIATALGWEPKREWVGLTDEEIGTLANEHLDVGDGICGRNFVIGEIEFARAIAAKLKEKNNG